MVASRSRISRRTSTEPTYTRCSTLACLLLESRRSEYGFFAHDSAGICGNSTQTQRCIVWVLRQFWLKRWVDANSNTKRLMAQSGSWCRVDFCDVHLNTCDITANVKVCRSTETKETRTKLERSLTRSQHDPPDVSEPRHPSENFFVRTPTEMPGSSSSEMRTETKPVVEPTVWRIRCLSRTTRVNRHLIRNSITCHGNG